MPRRIAVRRSSHRYFEKAARDAVRRSTWQAVPPDQAVPTIKACRTFRFRLERIPIDDAAGTERIGGGGPELPESRVGTLVRPRRP